MINKFAALLLIGMASPYQILDWYGGRHTASGALADAGFAGMSVGIGNIVEGHVKTYVAGAPRTMRNLGQVALYVQAQGKLELKFTFTGQQIASGFGYDLTVADFNSDGYMRVSHRLASFHFIV